MVTGMIAHWMAFDFILLFMIPLLNLFSNMYEGIIGAGYGNIMRRQCFALLGAPEPINRIRSYIWPHNPVSSDLF